MLTMGRFQCQFRQSTSDKIRALRTDLHSAVLLGGEDGNKAGNKEQLKRLYNICH